VALARRVSDFPATVSGLSVQSLDGPQLAVTVWSMLSQDTQGAQGSDAFAFSIWKKFQKLGKEKRYFPCRLQVAVLD
jgi:hypothetical protein